MKKRIAKMIEMIALIAVGVLMFATPPASAAVKKQDKPYFKAEMIYDKIPGYPSAHGSTIVETKNGDLVAAWYVGAFEKATDVAIFSSRIPAGKKEWTKPVVIHDTPDLSDGNPVLFEAPNGKLWLYFVAIYGKSWNDCPILAKYSTDYGRTWSEPRTIREKKGWMTRNKPIVLRDKRILLPLYDEGVFQPHFFISSDGGETWNNWGYISQYQTLQPTVIERKDGNLYCMLRNAAKGGIMQSESSNLGKSWSKAAPSGLPNPGSAVDMVKLADGHVALAFNDSNSNRNPLTIAL
ncbi:MAG TPA: exo-alpha-sialidase, partial [bacterium]|nr:exo-alpha-sialidase [bacterium]